jgi:hypothetical protein
MQRFAFHALTGVEAHKRTKRIVSINAIRVIVCEPLKQLSPRKLVGDEFPLIALSEHPEGIVSKITLWETLDERLKSLNLLSRVFEQAIKPRTIHIHVWRKVTLRIKVEEVVNRSQSEFYLLFLVWTATRINSSRNIIKHVESGQPARKPCHIAELRFPSAHSNAGGSVEENEGKLNQRLQLVYSIHFNHLSDSADSLIPKSNFTILRACVFMWQVFEPKRATTYQ